MSNQMLNFLDVDLGLYVNNTTNFTNSETSTNHFNPDGNLAFSEFDSKNLNNNFNLQNSLQPNNLDTCDLDLSIDPLILLDENESSSSTQPSLHIFQANASEIQNLRECCNMNIVSPSSILNFESSNKQDSLNPFLASSSISDHNNNNLMGGNNDSIYFLQNNQASQQFSSNSEMDHSHMESSIIHLYSHPLDPFISNPMSTNEKENTSTKLQANSSMPTIGLFNTCNVSMKSQNFENHLTETNSNLTINDMPFQKDASSVLMNAEADITQFVFKDQGSLLNSHNLPSDLAFISHESLATG